MTAKPPPAPKDNIKVGSPLPFSVFGAEGQLLLAEGSVVESDHTRRMLISKGVYRDAAAAAMAEQAGEEPCAAASVADQSPLALLQRDYGANSAGRRFALTVAGDGDETYAAWVVGVHGRSIIVTAPRRKNGALVSVKVGQPWLCRAFQMTSAFRFRSAVQKVLFEPFPHVHIEAPQHVERRTVRSRPRAAVFVDVTLQAPLQAPAVMVDLSVSGGRLAIADGIRFERGHELRLGMALELIDARFELSLQANVIAVFGASDGRHPAVQFYGVKFESSSELDRLVLHGFVSGKLALEANSLWQLLSTAVAVNA